MAVLVNSAVSNTTDDMRSSSPAVYPPGVKLRAGQDTPPERETERRRDGGSGTTEQRQPHSEHRGPCRGEPGMGHSLRAAALLAVVVLSILVSLLVTSVQQQFGTRTFPSGSAAPGGDGEEEEEEEALRWALIQQLNQRRRELIPLLFPADPNGKRAPQSDPDSVLGYSLWNEVTDRDQMGCDSLVDMRAVEVLGSGYTKLVVRAHLAGGRPAVALKLVNEQGVDMNKCLEDFQDPAGCRELVSSKLRREMILLDRLRHPNVIQVTRPVEQQEKFSCWAVPLQITSL